MKSRTLAVTTALAAVAFQAGCGAGAPRLSARLEGVKTDRVTTSGAELTASVRLSSPSGVGLGINRAHVLVRAGEAKLAVVDEDVEIETVMVTGPKVVGVPVRIPFSMIVSAVPDAWSKGKVDVTVSVTVFAGDLAGDAGEVPTSVTLLAGATATLDSLKFEGLSFGDPFLVVAIRVKNENPAATVVVEQVTASVNLDGLLLVKERKGKETPTLAPGEDGIVRLEVPLDFAANPGLKKKIDKGYETLPFFADGKVTVSTATGRIDSDFHVEGGMMLHR